MRCEKSQILSYLMTASFLFLSACSIDLSIWSEHAESISGKVSMPGITSSAICLAGDKKVYLHKLNTDGSVNETSIASVDLDVSFNYDFKNIPGFDQSASYILKADACGKKLTRPVTGLGEQNISYTSSLVGLIPYVQIGGVKKLQDLTPAQLEAAISVIANAPGVSTSESMSEVYDNLAAAAAQSTQITNAFNLNAINDLVAAVPPYIDTLAAPTAYNEMSAASHTVTAAHWYGSYTAAYEWLLNGSSESTTATYSFTPTKNSQGSQSLILKMGTDNGGVIDNSYAVFEHQFNINILDTFPAISPPLTRTSAAITNSSTVALSLDTGASNVNCETFSTFALSESAVAAAVSASAFTGTCTTATAQTESYGLSPGDGPKTIYLWAKDAAGNISATATSVTVTLDTTAPTVSLAGVPLTPQGSNPMNLSFTATDSGSGIAVVKLQYSSDNVTFTDAATLSTSPYTGYTPTASGYLRLYAEDNAGNPNTTTPVAFTFDNTPPSAPVPTLTTPAITNNTTVGFTVANCTDTTSILYSETATAPAANSTSWVTCSTATTYNHTIAGETTHTIYVWAKDAAGNVSTTSGNLSVILDTTLPTVTWVLPTTDLRVNTTNTVSWRVTDIHTSASQNTVLQYSDDAGVTWSTLSTQALPASSASNQLFTYSWLTPPTFANARLRVTTTDAATNQRQITKDLIIESQRPVIDTFTLADGETIVGIASVNAKLAVTPSTSVTSWMRFGTTNFDPNTDDGVGWLPFSAEGMSYVLSSVSTAQIIYAQVKNNAGIMSLTKPYTITLELGTPPSITMVTPTGFGTYLPSQVMHISWNCASTDANIELANPPISSIQYTIDDGMVWPRKSGHEIMQRLIA